VVVVEDSSPNDVDHPFCCVHPEYEEDSAESEAATALLDASHGLLLLLLLFAGES
jgi:hypothetical protein